MNIKTSLPILLFISLSMANISGIVTDTAKTPISGAIVLLEKGGRTTTTGTDGLFTLAVNTAVSPGESNRSPSHNPSAAIYYM